MSELNAGQPEHSARGNLQTSSLSSSSGPPPPPPPQPPVSERQRLKIDLWNLVRMINDRGTALSQLKTWKTKLQDEEKSFDAQNRSNFFHFDYIRKRAEQALATTKKNKTLSEQTYTQTDNLCQEYMCGIFERGVAQLTELQKASSANAMELAVLKGLLEQLKAQVSLDSKARETYTHLPDQFINLSNKVDQFQKALSIVDKRLQCGETTYQTKNATDLLHAQYMKRLQYLESKHDDFVMRMERLVEDSTTAINDQLKDIKTTVSQLETRFAETEQPQPLSSASKKRKKALCDDPHFKEADAQSKAKVAAIKLSSQSNGQNGITNTAKNSTSKNSTSSSTSRTEGSSSNQGGTTLRLYRP